jgi:hypothetical protein
MNTNIKVFFDAWFDKDGRRESREGNATLAAFIGGWNAGNEFRLISKRDRIARLMWAREAPDHQMDWDDAPDHERERYRCLADAALEIVEGAS